MPDPQRDLEAWWQLGRGRLAADRTVELPLLSGSMRPLLAPGTVLSIRPATWRECRPGDIAVFRFGDRLMAHRVLLLIAVGERALCYQKGDLNPIGQWIFGRCIVGRVVAGSDQRGCRHEFESAAARDRARTLASASLRGDIVHRLLALPRRCLTWLRRR